MRQNYDSTTLLLSLSLSSAFSLPPLRARISPQRNATTTSSLPHYRRAFNEFPDQRHLGQQNLAILKSFIALVQNFPPTWLQPRFVLSLHAKNRTSERSREREREGKILERRKGRRTLAIGYGLTSVSRKPRVSLFFFGKQTFEALKRDFQGHSISIPEGK